VTQQSPFHLEAFGATNLGGNTRNEDHFRVDDKVGLFAVADGVATLNAPAVAAEAAVEALFTHVTDPNLTPPADARQRMERTLAHVNRRVREQAAADSQLRGMAASLACAMDRGRLLVVGHVGECRVVRIRDGRLERLTVEHRRGTDPLVLWERR
jgi:protein phosphatase